MDTQSTFPNSSHSSDPLVDLGWLIRPRWGSAAAFLVTLLVAQLGVIQPMPALPVLLGALVTAISNLAASRLVRPGSPVTAMTTGLLLFDAALLTVVLYFSGGAANPLTALYLVPIALAAVIMPARFAWMLAGITVSAFFLLFFSPESHHYSLPSPPPLPSHDSAHHGHSSGFGLHVKGMWVTFTLTTVSVVYFVTQVVRALRQREAELAFVGARASRAERVAALASLAASTAHELGTPLASIQLAASEMEFAIRKGAQGNQLSADVSLVREQVRRCRDILDTMLHEAGETVGEQPTKLLAADLVQRAVHSLPEAEQGRVQFNTSLPPTELRTPPRIVVQALHNLIRNGLDASSIEEPVTVTVQASGPCLEFVVADRGIGMDPATLAGALEPFVTSKPGRGKGLGLFLTNAVAERLGGQLVLESEPGSGTRATFRIPTDPMANHSHGQAPTARAPSDT